MTSRTDALREGMKLGFEHAREYPDCTLEEFLRDIDSLREQLEERPSWQLRLLSGEGTLLDKLRYKFHVRS
jgi:hypothetical protein